MLFASYSTGGLGAACGVASAVAWERSAKPLLGEAGTGEGSSTGVVWALVLAFSLGFLPKTKNQMRAKTKASRTKTAATIAINLSLPILEEP